MTNTNTKNVTGAVSKMGTGKKGRYWVIIGDTVYGGFNMPEDLAEGSVVSIDYTENGTYHNIKKLAVQKAASPAKQATLPAAVSDDEDIQDMEGRLTPIEMGMLFKISNHMAADIYCARIASGSNPVSLDTMADALYATLRARFIALRKDEEL